MFKSVTRIGFSFVVAACLFASLSRAQDWRGKLKINWEKIVGVSRTVPTYQRGATQMTLPNSPLHDPEWRNMHNLGAEYARFQSYFWFGRLSVAELEPPQEGKTYWDFSYMDPPLEDFLEATKGHTIILNIATIPQWMFKTPKAVSYPADVNELNYGYEQGTELRDPSMKEVAEYFARLASWYTRGGFRDEYGQWHASGHRYKIEYWEVLNEVDMEHQMTPETYTALYDAVVEAIRRVDPQMKFVGMALGGTSTVPIPEDQPRFFEYFLDPKNHKPGIPVDMISYHFYALPGPDEDPYVQQFTVFDQGDRFLSLVKYIDSIRQRLAPKTRTTIDEIGIISADDMMCGTPGHVSKPIPDSYWNLSAAFYAYIYHGLSRLGIQAAAMGAILGYPNNVFPSTTMMDWKTGQPNARYWALKLLIENAGPGDKQVETTINLPFVEAQGYVRPDGQRKILLVNKRDRPFGISMPGMKGGSVQYVDQKTNFQPAVSQSIGGDKLTLSGFAVAVVTLPH